MSFFKSSIAGAIMIGAAMTSVSAQQVSPALLEYQTKMATVQRNVALAALAQMCGLRSERWIRYWPEPATRPIKSSHNQVSK